MIAASVGAVYLMEVCRDDDQWHPAKQAMEGQGDAGLIATEEVPTALSQYGTSSRDQAKAARKIQSYPNIRILSRNRPSFMHGVAG